LEVINKFTKEVLCCVASTVDHLNINLSMSWAAAGFFGMFWFIFPGALNKQKIVLLQQELKVFLPNLNVLFVFFCILFCDSISGFGLYTIGYLQIMFNKLTLMQLNL
jgi:hypothetical protein